ncbi:PREDICTED: uncharacterized protein LOC104815522 isoform X2 [Tarenaya hassleriana]|uniref:uncharacterized protein LOC104815522 isoform X2 n=1 Tax=Tarenaya hassleriana TaxID=28532 RepID=UPI00053C15AF|nr:PREDICTED: uncharacterized protein LOC104815522 isoform X2 [Tarenaya hassleriana]
MEKTAVEKAVSALEDVSKGLGGYEMYSINLEGIEVVHAETGLLRCLLAVPISTCDGDGKWHVGAMTTAMEVVGSVAVLTLGSQYCKTLELTISYYSSAKSQERVEIEAKIVGTNGNLRSVEVKTTRHGTHELIALAKLWSLPAGLVPSPSKL